MNSQLMYAIINEASLEEIQVLINWCQDINKVEKNIGLTPLIAAIIFHPEVIPLLMAHLQLDVNKTNCYGQTALFYAASFGHDLSPFLTYPNIDVNAQDYMGDTALHLAIFYSHRAKICQLLADPRTDTSLKNWLGKDAVDLAKNEHPELLPLFRREILALVSPKVVPRLGGTSATRLPTKIMFQVNKMLYM